MKKSIFYAMFLSLILSAVVLPISAQDTTTAQNSVQINYVACGDAGVINVSGTLLAGWDVYYQLFDAANGAGNALSTLR